MIPILEMTNQKGILPSAVPSADALATRSNTNENGSIIRLTVLKYLYSYLYSYLYAHENGSI